MTASWLRVLLAILLAAMSMLALPARAGATSFAAGSLVVPMDVAYQNYGMFKAYGLVYRLLQSGVPVHWAIGSGKTFGGADFQATTVNHYNAAQSIGSPYTYTGGPFVIAASDVAVADPVITAWRNANGANPSLAIHEATASFSANVDIVLRRAPRIALESINSGIAIAYFNAAGIPDGSGGVWTALSPNVLNAGLIGCNNASAASCPVTIGDSALFQSSACSTKKYDVFVTPHNSGYAYSLSDPTNVGTQAYAELDNFVAQGGGWIALCHSVLSNENAVVDLYANSAPAVRSLLTSVVGGGFLTKFGFPAIDNKGGTWTVLRPDLPIGQAVATTVTNGLPGGSVQTWHKPDGTPTYVQYWLQTERVAEFVTGGEEYDWAVNGVYHNGSGRGKLTFLGGHSYSTSLPYSNNFEAPYLRFFYNALFFNGSAVAEMSLDASVPSISQGAAAPIQLVFRNRGGATATNVGVTGGVTITLQPGFTFTSMAVGPNPTVAAGPGGTTILTWGALGDIPSGSSALVINVTAFFASTGIKQAATMSGTYGDTFNEIFSSNGCAALQVNPAPAAQITKTPATQGPLNVGDVVTWTLTYSNPGSANLQNPDIDDVLPSSFQFVSASPAPAYVVPVAGGARVHWDIASPLAAGGSGTITLRAVVQTATNQPFTNSVTFTGTDAASIVYSSSASADVSVNPPLANVNKTVSPSGTITAPATLTYTLSPSAPGPTLLNGVRFFDAPPVNTTYVAASANQGGTFGAYVPQAAVNGIDAGPSPSTDVALSVGSTPFTYAVGSNVTVTMVLTNSDPAGGFDITGVVPQALVPSDPNTTCSGPSQTNFTVTKSGGTATVTYTCTIGAVGEITFDGTADGSYNGAAYSFGSGTSSSVLGVPTTTGTNVVQWIPTTSSNTDDVPSSSFAAGTGPGLFLFEGGSANWERYDITTNAWARSGSGLTNTLPAATGDGAAIANDGGGSAGYAYAFRGGATNAFWRYQISDGLTGAWNVMANAPGNVGAGGALTALGGFLYALQGGGASNAFWKYDPGTNTWTALASIPQALLAGPKFVGAGGALTTDGTYIYALQGNNQNKFVRYNVGTNTWSAQSNAPNSVKAGGALTHVGTTLFYFPGGNSNHFAQFVPNATTGKWTNKKNTPANVNAGAGLASDGTSIWGTRGGNTSAFWVYSKSTNLWIVKTSTSANVTTGGALAWVPASTGANNTNALTAPVLVTGVSGNAATIKVTMTLTSSIAVSNVTPGNLAVASTNATPATSTPATNCSLDAPTTQNITAGGTLTFTWTCTNVTATGSTLANTLGTLTFSAAASSTSPVSSWASATSNSVLVTKPLTYQVTVPSSPTTFDSVSNQALLSDDVAFATGVGSNVVMTPVDRPPNVSVTKSVNPASGQSVKPLDTVTYTLSALNASAGQATSVVVTDAIPANTTYVSCTASIGTCAKVAGNAVFTVGTLAGYQTATLTFTVTANVPAAAGSYTLQNQATFTGSGSGGGFSGSSNAVSNTLVADPAAVVAKAQSVVPAPDVNGFVAPGSTITYTLVASNPANSVPATSVVVTDLIPTGTTYVPGSCAGASCTFTTGPPKVAFNVGTVNAGSVSAPLTFQVTVDNPAVDGGQIINAATIAGDGGLTGTSNPVSYSIAAAPVVSIAKSASPASGSTVVNNQVITYTLVVKNTGNANTASAFVNDTIPANTQYVASSTTLNGNPVPEVTPGVAPVTGNMKVYSACCADPSGDGGTLVSENAAGGTANDATVTFQVRVTTPVGVASTITNQATAGTATTVAVTSNATTHSTAAQTDLAIVKSGPANVSANGAVSYTLVVTNNGPSAAGGAVVTDPVVANFTATGVSCGSASGGAVCPGSPTVAQLQGAGVTIPTLPVGGSLTFTVSGTAGVNGSIANGANVTAPAGVSDPTPANNASTANTTIAGVADLAVQKSAPTVVAANGAVSYALHVVNLGPSSANGASLADTLPASLGSAQITACSASFSAACPALALPLAVAGTFNVTIPTLPAGGAVDLTVTGTAPNSATTLTNSASVSTPVGTSDPDSSNNTSQVTTSVTTTPVQIDVADLGVIKSGPSAVAVNGAVTYVIVATNAGPATVTGAVLRDAAVANFTAATVTCTNASGTSCPSSPTVAQLQAGLALPAMPAGSTLTFTLSGTAGPANGTITNVVTIAPPSGVTDNNPANDSASVVTQVQASPPAISADVLLTKVGPATVAAGASVSYTLTVVNLGPGAADGSRVTDALPAALGNQMLALCNASNGATCPALSLPQSLSGNLDVIIPTLPAGGKVVLTVGGTAPGAGATFANLAVVRLPTTVSDPVPGNNIGGPVQTTVVAPDLIVAKTASKGSVAVAEAYSYTLQASNAGSAPSTLPTTVTDNVPAGLTLGSVNAGANWSCGTVGQVVTCDRTAGMPAGTANELVATLNVTPTNALSGQNVVNQASIVGDGETPSCSAPVVNCASASVGVGLAPVSVSGVVYDDGDGNGVQGGGEAGTNGGGLNVVLTDSSNVVLAVTAVAANGSYSFASVSANTAVQLIVTTANPALGSSYNPVSPPLPANWVNTTAATRALSTGTTNATGQDFGIEQLPVAVAGVVPSQTNPGGSNTVAVPTGAFTASTDADGTVTAYRITLFPSSTVSVVLNGTSYTAGTFPAGGVVVPNANIGNVLLDPVDGNVVALIPFLAIDNASRESANTATITMSFATISISGTVWHDIDGSAAGTFTNIRTNAESGTNAGVGFNAILVNGSGTIVSAAPVIPDGTYSLVNLQGNQNNLTIRLATTGGVAGDPAPPASIPSGWVGTTPLTTASFNLVTSSITGRDFGIEQPPTASGGTQTSQANPGGTTSVNVDSTLFGANDADGTIASYRVTAFPSNATTITIGGTTYTAGSFPGGGVSINGATIAANAISVDPVDGAVTVSIPYLVTDNAGQTSSIANMNVPFGASTTADLSIVKTGPFIVNSNGVVNYTIAVANAGPASADNAVLTDPAVANFTATILSCSNATGGAVCPSSPTIAALQGAGIVIPTLPSGGLMTFALSGTAGLSGAISNTATIAPPVGTTDTNGGNDTSTLSTTIHPLVDVAIVKSGPPVVSVNGSIIWTLRLTNAGPVAADGAVAFDFLPPAVPSATLAACTASGGASCPAGALPQSFSSVGSWAIPSLPAGGQVLLTITATAPATPQTLLNNGSVSVPPTLTDVDVSDNGSDVTTAVTVTSTPAQLADLGVAKAGPSAVGTGGAVTYTVVATNAGPATVVGAVLTDTLPAALGAVTWSCAASGGAACPAANGSGPISATLGALPPASVLTWTVTGAAPSVPGMLTNTVTIAAPGGVTDSNPANDSASVVTQVQASPPAISADVLLTKVGPATVAAGASVSYTLTVVNLGPGAADGSRVTDALPAALGNQMLALCNASNGATCPALSLPQSLSGNLDVIIPTLPAGGKVVLTVGGTAPGAGATFANLAVVRLPTTVSDPVPGNNIGGPVQTTVVAPDLIVAKTASKGSVAVAEAYSYTLQASNAGSAPSTLPTTVTDNVPAGLTLGSVNAGANWSCGTVGQVVTCDRTAGMPAGTANELVATLNVTPTNALSGQNVVNQASIVGDGETPSCSAPVVNCASASVGVGLAPVSVSGVVYDDGDGNGVQGGGEAGTNGGGLNVVLTDSSNVVLAVTAVAANGSYSFASVSANTAVQLIVTTANPALGSSYNPVSPPLPANWVNTTAATRALSTGTTNATGQDFGIEQLPVAVAGVVPSQTNPGGSNTVAVPTGAFTASTDADGTVTAYRLFFPSNVTSMTIGGTTYTIPFPGGLIATVASLGTMVIDPIDGNVTVSIAFRAIDNANRESTNTATMAMPFTAAVAPAADLRILKSGPSGVGPGATLSYQLTITNGGPGAADGAVVSDPAVANFNATGVSCALASGGAACPALPLVSQLQGAGIAIPVLPAGGSVTLTIDGVAARSGDIQNVATVTPPAGITDPVPADNVSRANTGILAVIPTLSQWMLLVLTLLLVGIAGARLARRR